MQLKKIFVSLGSIFVLCLPIAATANDAKMVDDNVIVMKESKIAPFQTTQTTTVCGPYTWTAQWTTQRFPQVITGRVTVSVGDNVHEFANAQADIFSKADSVEGVTALCPENNGLPISHLLIGTFINENGDDDTLKLYLPEGFAVPVMEK